MFLNNMFTTKTEWRLAAAVMMLALPAAYGLYAMSADAVAATARSQVAKDNAKFTVIKPEVLAMIEKGEADFMKMDAERSGDSITEDFTWYRVMPEGPKLAVQGRENTVKLMAQFFKNDAPAGFESDVYRLAMVGNILVQVEVDRYDSKTEGKVEKTSLEVYEFRDGRRFREWRFTPTASPFDK